VSRPTRIYAPHALVRRAPDLPMTARSAATSSRTAKRSTCLSSAGTKPRPPSAISTAGSGGIGRSGDGGQAGTAEEEADDGTSEANSLGCASQQDSRKGARSGWEEASKVACPDREEGASKAQATEEDLARQVVKSSTGRSPGTADRRPCLWQKRLSPSGAGRCVFASGILPCSVSFATTCRGKAGH
jgi:hypothetical protein